MGSLEDILDANRLILDDLRAESKGRIENSVIKGKVHIGSGSTIKKGSVINGPATIGKKCTLSSVRIGPHTSIGDNCQIIGTEIKNSIVMENTRIVKAGKIAESLIGKNVVIEKGPPKGKFIIGDNSTVKL